ncbi:hypothetical protein HY224_02710 [Candidatus Uhrbacteria bacterium]|nr:hypothetical protein [Candidatus Uhrbacteria bacterium]
MRQLYTLDNYGKQLLLRYILASKSGLLPNPEKRQPFLRHLFKDWVRSEDEQKDVMAVLEQIEVGLESVQEWQLLYFALQAALYDKIAIPPKKTTPWGEVEPVQEELVHNFTDFDEYDSEKANRVISNLRVRELPRAAKAKPWQHVAVYDQYVQQRLHEVVSGLGVAQETPGRRERPSPLQFSKDIICRTGAVGVRFLQLLPQFIEVPADYQKEFSEVQ